LDEATKSSDIANGYKVRLKWSTSKEPDDVNNFSLRFRTTNSDDDDEKKAVDEWQIAEYGPIEKIENTKFAVNLNAEMAFYVKYEFEAAVNISEPFPMTITSNVMQFGIDGKPKGDVVQVPLMVSSYRNHYTSYHPRNLFTSDSSFYASPVNAEFAENENDWLIFNVAKDHLYFPTKFCIQNHYGDTQGVKTMKVWIGDGQNEWYMFQPSIINVASNQQMQQFDIEGVAAGMIKQKKLSHFKIEFVTNHSCTTSSSCRYVVEKFQLFGVKSAVSTPR